MWAYEPRFPLSEPNWKCNRIFNGEFGFEAVVPDLGNDGKERLPLFTCRHLSLYSSAHICSVGRTNRYQKALVTH